MRVLVVGSGGREHALVWKLAQSPLVEKLYCAPGNAGIARMAECVPIGVNDFPALTAFARERAIDLTVVGPEDPLSKGLADRFTQEGLRAFGPSAAAAKIEASKAFAKHIMRMANIPTADYAEFSELDEAIAYVASQEMPVVIKADGLAAGKGVTVAHDRETAIAALRAAMGQKVFGDAGSRVIIEECLVGEEASILAFSDGVTVVPMPPSQDHKPVFDGDEGPNTGGMGAYSPAPVVTNEMLADVHARILQPCVDALAKEGAAFKGVLYAGLMITKEGPKVIEFNCRFGDPETQVVLPRLASDLAPILLACCEGRLADAAIAWKPDTCVSVVLASGGYPGDYAKGIPISGLDAQTGDDVMVFHAGTTLTDGVVVTNGGRVLNVTAIGETIEDAIRKAYVAAGKIHFEGAHYRKDIGAKALRRITATRPT